MDGFECAGHPGEDDIGGLVLLAKAAKKLTVPYVASGGIADGKQLAAVMCLGADGVNMGTRFTATKECMWPQSFKERMVEADERQTVLMFRQLHNTARCFKNKVAAEVQEIEKTKGADLEFAVSGARCVVCVCVLFVMCLCGFVGCVCCCVCCCVIFLRQQDLPPPPAATSIPSRVPLIIVAYSNTHHIRLCSRTWHILLWAIAAGKQRKTAMRMEVRLCVRELLNIRGRGGEVSSHHSLLSEA